MLAAPGATLSVAAPATLTLSGIISGPGGLTAGGPGIMKFTQTNNYAGGTTLNGGVAVFAPGAGLPASGSVLMNAGAKMVLQGGSLAAITASLASGLTLAKDWSGTGILAGAPAITGGAATHGIGIMTATQWASLNGMASFGSYTVQPADVLLRYTYMGDATFDGAISMDDYLRIDAGFLGHLTGWFNGDFNYDGTVTGADYAFIDNAYRVQSGTLADGMIAAHAAEFGQEYLDALTSLSASPVPEPASLLLLGAGALLAQGNRNARRHRARNVVI